MRATDVIKKGKWVGFAIDTVVLDYDGRRRRRMALEGIGGVRFLLDLAKPPNLMPGDALLLDDGRLIKVEAAPEDLLQITCEDANITAQIAYQLGIFLLPVELGDGYLRVRADRRVAPMVADIGGHCQPVRATFYPDGPPPIIDPEACPSHHQSEDSHTGPGALHMVELRRGEHGVG